MLLKDRVAVITGAGSGVGRATALIFAQEGARVVLGDLREDWGQETLRQIQAAGGEGRFCAGDVRRERDVAALIETAVRVYGRLDIMFNNAGVASPRNLAFEDYADEDWDRLIDTNLRSVFYGCKHAVQQFKRQGGGGVILNTASVAGLVGMGTGPYGAAKGGVVQLTRSLAITLAADQIRVNCLCPGGMATQFGAAGSGLTDHVRTPDELAERAQAVARLHPLGRAITPEDVAHAALFLASEQARNITGVALPIDGGYVAR